MQSVARTRFAFLLLLVIAAGAASQQPLAQTSSTSGPGLPVSVDFLLVANDGRPVPDLKVEEVALRIDGKLRTIHSLKRVQVTGTMAQAANAVPTPFSTNALTAAGRTVIVVIDDESIRTGSERGIQTAMAQFLAGLSPNDRVALITIPHGGMKVDFTSDFEKVRNAMALITGQAPQTESMNDAACRTRNDLQALTGILDSLGGGQGPVSVVFVSGSMTGSRRNITMSRTTATSTGTAGMPGATTMGACELLPEEFERVGAAAVQARAYFYVIRPELSALPQFINPDGGSGVAARNSTVQGTNSITQGIEDLNGVTGGIQMPISGSGSGDNALIRVAMETSAHYVVTFDPDEGERNGTTHKVDLKINRPDVTLRTLPAVIIPAVNQQSAAGAAPAPAVTPRTMLGEVRAYRDLALRTSAIPARDAQNPNKVRVIVAFEPEDQVATVASAMAGLFDSTGKLVSQWTALPSDLTKSPMIAALVAPPGKYRLRVAATDKSQRSGATDTDIDTTLEMAGPLKLSALGLGSQREGMFLPKLQFTDEPVAIAYMEIYGQFNVDQSIVAMIQVAKTLDGPAFLVQPASIDPTKDPDRFVLEAAIPIGGLPPGDYVVRALVGVGVEGEKMGRVVRVLRKTTK